MTRGSPGPIELVANSHVENVYWPVFQLIELAFMQIRLVPMMTRIDSARTI